MGSDNRKIVESSVDEAFLQPCSSVDDANEAIVISEMSSSIEAENGVELCQH